MNLSLLVITLGGKRMYGVDTNGGELVLVSDDDPKTETNWTIYLMRLSIQQSLLTVDDSSQDY